MPKNPFKLIGARANKFIEGRNKTKRLTPEIEAPKPQQKEQTPKKDAAALLAEAIPNLVQLPKDFLGSKTKAGAALSAFGSMLGDFIKLKNIANRVEEGLRKELKTDQSIIQIFADPDLKNRAIQSDFVKGLLSDARIWREIQKPEQIKNLLQALDPECYKKLDEALLNIIESPSTITTKSKIELATSISETPAALITIQSILNAGGNNLVTYLSNSKVIGNQLTSIGIRTPEKQRQLFAFGVPLAKDIVTYLPEIMKVVGIVQKPGPIDIAELMEPAGNLVPMLRSESVSVFLDSNLMGPIVEELITSNANVLRSALGITEQSIQTSELSALMNSFVGAGMVMAKAIISDDTKILFITNMAQAVGAYNNSKEGTEERAKATKAIMDHFIENFEQAGFFDVYDQHIVPMLQENKANIAKLIEAKAAPNKVNGERIVNIISNSKNIMGLMKLAHQFSTATTFGKIKLATTLPRVMWDNFEAVKEIASIAGSLIKPYIKAKIYGKNMAKDQKSISNKHKPEETQEQQPGNSIDISAGVTPLTNSEPPSKSPSKASFVARIRKKFSRNKGGDSQQR